MEVVRVVVLFVVVRDVSGWSWRSVVEGSVRVKGVGAAVSITEDIFGSVEESVVVMAVVQGGRVSEVVNQCNKLLFTSAGMRGRKAEKS